MQREYQKRRAFLQAGVLAGGCLAFCPLLVRGAEDDDAKAQGDRQEKDKDKDKNKKTEQYVFDETMAYCCAQCTERCPFLSRDPEVRRQKAADLTKKLGREITPEQLTCSRCRVDDSRVFANVRACPIRKCVLDQKLLSCAHCVELPTCARANQLTRERALTIQRVVLGTPKEG